MAKKNADGTPKRQRFARQGDRFKVWRKVSASTAANAADLPQAAIPLAALTKVIAEADQIVVDQGDGAGELAYTSPQKEAVMIQRNAWVKKLGVLAVAAAVLAVVAMPVLGAATPPPAGSLDGKTFTGETGEKGKTKGDAETFVFKGQTFDPLDCHKYGFSAAPYTSKEEGGRIRFEAETKSAKEGSMRWKGIVQGETLAGTMIWTKAGQAPITYWFKGMLKK
jgi:hypothetical protein